MKSKDQVIFLLEGMDEKAKRSGKKLVVEYDFEGSNESYLTKDGNGTMETYDDELSIRLRIE